MLYMSFAAFLALFIISLIVSLIMHYGIRYRVLEGGGGFVWKWIVSWLGAWLGTPVLGHWFDGLAVANVSIIPAIIGAFVGAFLITGLWKAEAKVLGHRTQTM